MLSQKQRQAIVAISSTHKGDKAAKTAATAAAGAGEPAAMELLNPFFARMIWQEMLEAVDHIHAHRVVHGDLKVRWPAWKCVNTLVLAHIQTRQSSLCATSRCAVGPPGSPCVDRSRHRNPQ